MTTTHDEWIHPYRVTDYHVFIYLIEGRMHVIEDGTEYILQEGDILFLKKGVPHWGIEGTLPGTRTYWIHFHNPSAELQGISETVQESSQSLSMSSNEIIFSPKHYDLRIELPKHFKVKNAHYMTRKLKELYELYNSSRPARHLYLSIGTMEVLLDLYKESLDNQVLTKSDAVAHRLAEYLQTQSDEELDPEKIGAEFQLNYNYLSTLFKQKFGTSIFKYHERIRIQHAAELLKNTSMNISQVSEQVNYKCPYYFSRVFKKIMGESPSDYIKSIYRMY